jgi:flagellar hook-associated protein 2
MASIVSSVGVGSGIDINGLVTKLVSAERAPVVARLTRQETKVQAQISSLGNFKSALSSLRSSLAGLRSLGNVQKLNGTSSDKTILTVTAENNADLGNYRVEAKQLAQTHALASPAYNSANATVGTGTLTIKFGTTTYDAGTDAYGGFAQNADKGTLTLTIDSSNNTLTGIRDAINKAKAGVNAAVVYNGSGYQLVLNSADSGAKNSMQITVSGDGDSNDTDAVGLSALSFNASATHMSQTQQARDALASINGLEVSSSSNMFKDTLKGVTMTLLKAEPGKVVDVGISQAQASDLSKGVEAFVTSFNEVQAFVTETTGYNAATKTAGVLMGDAAVRGTMGLLRAELSRFVDGLTGNFRNLSDVGIAVQKDGTLKFDSAVFGKAVAADRDAVAAVFGVIGRPSDSGVSYLDANGDTKAGTYAVNVTQAATQGVLNGAAIGSLVVNADNDSFKISVDGVPSGTLTLTHGTYANGGALAAELQSRINGDSAFKGRGVSLGVSFDSAANRFVFTSKSFGSASTVSITEVDTNSAATLGLGVATGTAGRDIAGTIGGETAKGTGQQLNAVAGGASGIKLLIADATTGDRGNVQFSRGMVERLDKMLDNLLKTQGSVGTRVDGLQKTLNKIQTDRSNLDNRMAAYEKRLLTRFTLMDKMVGQLQATSGYLSQQLANLPLSNSNSGR